ncbi:MULTISPECIES: MBL fold metallo-hydrolase [Niastella]|uniref:Metallo-beta-lactamase domain-containing protein n=1 Tax=Niastella soli TaxID=2821487 RepID=A0ABS3Z524_9BACT|nr:MBL fold metallo-hydrolase [Niastella soli]MBO9204837.1 hypothetical protein [Niastella soli]
MITKQIAPDVYGVFPENDFDDKPNAPKGTSGGFIVGKNGVLVIESFLNADLAGQMISQIRKVTQLPVKFLVNTSYHGDHSYGNYIFPAGTTIIQHKATGEYVHQHFNADTVWMMQKFGRGRGIEKVVPRTAIS